MYEEPPEEQKAQSASKQQKDQYDLALQLNGHFVTNPIDDHISEKTAHLRARQTKRTTWKYGKV